MKPSRPFASACCRERAARVELGETRRHPRRILQVQQVGGAGEVKGSTFGSQDVSSRSRPGKVGVVFSPRTPNTGWLIRLASSWVNVHCGRALNDRLSAQTERIRMDLGDQLRPGLSVSEAGERYCALVSPELYSLLTVEFGWTADKHRRWLTDLLEAELLGPRPTTTTRL
jgi:hypothetical protein